MSYAALVDRLEDAFADEPRRVVALPDGSVDYCYRVTGPDGERIDAAETLGRLLAAGDAETFPLERTAVRPGGQAVNAAIQVDALGDDAALVGHLDHPVLADLPFETRSMGEPTPIHVLAFDGEERLFPAEPDRAADWGVSDLEAVVDRETLVGADALCCSNWVSFRGLTGVFERLAASGVDRPLVVDPGALGLPDEAAVATLFDALSAADPPLEVALSVNRREYEAAAAVADVDGDSPAAVLAALRSALEISAVVFHGRSEAIAATRTGTTAVETLAVDDPVLTTGAGDRFSGALASALAREWPWPAALALGNACASRFVATGETADRATLRAVLRERC